ncbi:MAG: response regulator [Chlorobi bacterium]|nr:response regulator [Chlorobiota bacterium]
MIIKSILIISFLFFSSLSFGNTEFKRITTKDGLSSNRTYRSVQDKNGFVWITTDNGVDRYDGNNIVHYNLEKQDEIAGIGYQFNMLVIDDDDNIFLVNNRNYIYRFNRNTDRFELIKKFKPYFGKYVFDAIISSNKELIIGTPSNLLIYDYKNDSLRKPRQALNLFAIHSLIEVQDGFIILKNNKVIKVNYDFTETKTLGELIPSEGVQNTTFRALAYTSKDSSLWIGTVNSGLLHYDMAHNKFSLVKSYEKYKDFPIRDLLPVNDSVLLIGTDGTGLIEINTNTDKTIAHYRFDQDDESSIGSNVVHGILHTMDSLYFITTDIGGVSIMNPKKPAFISIKREKGNPNSLRNNVIYTIRELSPGNIVFGTDRGLSFWNRNTGKWKHPGLNSANSRNNVVTQIANAKNGTYWVSYFIDQTKVFNAKGKFKYLPGEIANTRNSKAMLFDDRNNTLWIARNGQNVRLISYNFDDNTISHFNIPVVQSLLKYGKIRILTGTSDGLYVIDIRNNDFTVINSLKGNLKRVISMAYDERPYVWIGSDGGGLAKLNLKNGKYKLLTTEDGLSSNHIYTLNIDNQGNIWAGSDKGLSKINIKTNKIYNYFESDGVIKLDYMHKASCNLHSGEIIIGGANGAIIFNPLKITPPTYTNNIIFTSLYVNQKKITVANSKILTTELNKTKSIKLKYGENSFSIEFTNIDLIHPKQHKYTWKLEGFDSDWSKPTSIGTATYSKLPPGDYTFRVKLVSNIISDEKGRERILKISITPPIWRSPIAIVIYLLFILFIILLALYYNKLMHDVRSTRDKLQYIANMAHEIKTPLSLIRAPIDDVLRKTEDDTVKEKLKLAIENIEKLHKKISQFLDFRRIDKIEQIHPERIDVIAFLKKKIFAFSLVAEKRNIKLNFESAYESQIIFSSPDILDRIISNLLSNAVKYNRPGGFINVRILIEEPYWTLIVTDSGIGIPKKELKKIFRPFYRAENAIKANKPGSGVGLALVSDIVKVLKGTIKIKSKEGKGTTVSVKFPIGNPDIYNEEKEQAFSDTEQYSDESSDTTNDKDKIKILIVEDDSELRNYIKNELAEKYQVIEASNGEEAFNKVQKELPDLVLSDVAMPRMNGRQLCINIKSKPVTSHIPVILLSGLDSKEHILKGLEAGADDYITKPFDSSILIAKIENLINNRKKVKDLLLDPQKGNPEAEIKNDFDKEFVAQITRLVEENISDPELSVRLLYTSVGMSRTAFYHKLKSLIDMSPAEFIRLIRLNKAKELLLSNKYNINEVAYMCGFSDAKYFSTSFKKHFGKSPSAFVSGK